MTKKIKIPALKVTDRVIHRVTGETGTVQTLLDPTHVQVRYDSGHLSDNTPASLLIVTETQPTSIPLEIKG